MHCQYNITRQVFGNSRQVAQIKKSQRLCALHGWSIVLSLVCQQLGRSDFKKPYLNNHYTLTCLFNQSNLNIKLNIKPDIVQVERCKDLMQMCYDNFQALSPKFLSNIQLSQLTFLVSELCYLVCMLRISGLLFLQSNIIGNS